jgi:hypothetical protein
MVKDFKSKIPMVKTSADEIFPWLQIENWEEHFEYPSIAYIEEMGIFVDEDATEELDSSDGRGINTEKLREKALAAGVFKPHDRPSYADLCRLVLSANLSTTDNVSEISGRGIGMGAVAAVVHEMGCMNDVTSEPGSSKY